LNPIDLHQRHADRLRAAATGASGQTAESVRIAALTRAAGGAPIDKPYDGLAQQIRDAAWRVTDAHVAAVRAATGSDKGAFEIIMAASIGAGLARWDAAARAIDEAGDAAS